MPEGMLSGILAHEDHTPEVEAPDALDHVQAFASAVAAKLAGNDPEVARRTAEFLIDQSHVLKIQAEHLKDEHGLRLAHLRHQLREENIRRFGLRLRVGFQLFLALGLYLSITELKWKLESGRSLHRLRLRKVRCMILLPLDRHAATAMRDM